MSQCILKIFYLWAIVSVSQCICQPVFLWASISVDQCILNQSAVNWSVYSNITKVSVSQYMLSQCWASVFWASDSVSQCILSHCNFSKCILSQCIFIKFILIKCIWKPVYLWSSVSWASVLWPERCIPILQFNLPALSLHLKQTVKSTILHKLCKTSSWDCRTLSNTPQQKTVDSRQ